MPTAGIKLHGCSITASRRISEIQCHSCKVWCRNLLQHSFNGFADSLLEVKYVPNPKTKGSKSFDRYAKYEKACGSPPWRSTATGSGNIVSRTWAVWSFQSYLLQEPCFNIHTLCIHVLAARILQGQNCRRGVENGQQGQLHCAKLCDLTPTSGRSI
eukprot:4620237-Amphidinium_carterae.1